MWIYIVGPGCGGMFAGLAFKAHIWAHHFMNDDQTPQPPKPVAIEMSPVNHQNTTMQQES